MLVHIRVGVPVGGGVNCSTHIGNEASELLQLCVTEGSCIHKGVCQWPCSYIEVLICGIALFADKFLRHRDI